MPQETTSTVAPVATVTPFPLTAKETYNKSLENYSMQHACAVDSVIAEQRLQSSDCTVSDVLLNYDTAHKSCVVNRLIAAEEHIPTYNTADLLGVSTSTPVCSLHQEDPKEPFSLIETSPLDFVGICVCQAAKKADCLPMTPVRCTTQTAVRLACSACPLHGVSKAQASSSTESYELALVHRANPVVFGADTVSTSSPRSKSSKADQYITIDEVLSDSNFTRCKLPLGSTTYDSDLSTEYQVVDEVLSSDIFDDDTGDDESISSGKHQQHRLLVRPIQGGETRRTAPPTIMQAQVAPVIVQAEECSTTVQSSVSPVRSSVAQGMLICLLSLSKIFS